MNRLDYTKRSVQGILERFNQLVALKYKGNVDAIISTIDISRAVKKCEFTLKQREIFHYLFTMEYTPDEVAKKLNISRQCVLQHKDRIVTKVYNALEGRAA